jgi:uncharacterized protein (TIGR02145 family)
MKKLYFFFLLLPLWGFGGIAHASVTVKLLDTDFTNKTVTLHVEYDNAVNDRVWVWIYLCDMQTMFQPAEISAASATSGSVLYISTQGFFVTSSPATVTATLSNALDQFSCCAYGSDAPPNVTDNNGTYTFKGTPPFIVIHSDGSTNTVSVKTGYTPESGKTITAVVSDRTGYPGCLVPGGTATFADFAPCPGMPYASTWTLTDTRDSKNYRVVKMPDERIWMGQSLNYHGVAYTCSGNVAANCDNGYGALYCYSVATAAGFCPSGWHLPTDTEWGTMLDLVEGSGNAHINCPLNNISCGQNAGQWLKSSNSWDGSGSPYNDTFEILPSGWQVNTNWSNRGTQGNYISMPRSGTPLTVCARSFGSNRNDVICGNLFADARYCGAVRCLQD